MRTPHREPRRLLPQQIRSTTLAEAIAGLRSTLNTDAHLDSMLQRLAETAVKALPDADAVSVTVLSADGPRTAASTADYLSAIDDAQHSADRGPCVDAARTMSSVRSKVGDHDDKWPEFTPPRPGNKVSGPTCPVPLTMGEGKHRTSRRVQRLRIRLDRVQALRRRVDEIVHRRVRARRSQIHDAGVRHTSTSNSCTAPWNLVPRSNKPRAC